MNETTSIFIKNQVPEFVRDDYPLFVSFLKAYYEFLEQKQPNIKNDLITQTRNLKHITDVDYSLEEFTQQFFNTFANNIPKNVAVDKSFFIKNILPLYQSKGSENSFKFLFRLLFNEEIDIYYPSNDILRLSAGKWKTPKSVKISNDISTYYDINEPSKQFKLLYAVKNNDISVYINGNLVESGFKVFSEYKTIIFDDNLSQGDTLEIFYNRNIDIEIFINRQLYGNDSNASSIVEKAFPKIINNNITYELFVDERYLINEFQNSELLLSTVFVDDILLNVRFRTLSELDTVHIIEMGSNYNVGDPVIITSPGSDRNPTAIVSATHVGNIERLAIFDPGTGYQVGSRIYAEGYDITTFDAKVVSIFAESSNTINTFIINSDIISDIDPSNIKIDSITYGLNGQERGNLNTIIQLAFANTAFVNIGEVIGYEIYRSDISFNNIPKLDVEPAKVIIPPTGNTTTNTTLTIRSYGTLGKLKIVDGGNGYVVGDEIVVTNQPDEYGIGAEGEVMEVHSNGAIKLVQFLPSKISGTGYTESGNIFVNGVNTYFESELVIGSKILINNETRIVNNIISNTTFTVSDVFEHSSNNRPIRLYEKNLIGGQNYTQDKLPIITVDSETGNGANVIVTCILGYGEDIRPVFGNNKPGGIKNITILDHGKGLLSESTTFVNLTGYGDGTATANVSLIPSFETFAGYYLNSDGLLSSDKKLQGMEYYIDYSYVILSKIDLNKYKQTIKDLLHPSGSKLYGEVLHLDEIASHIVDVSSELTIESS